MKNVHQRGPSLYYVEYLGRVNGKPKYKWTRLCRADASQEEINGAVWRHKTHGAGTLAAIMDDYVKTRLKKRAMATQKEYERLIEKRLKPTFGHMRPDDVTQQDIAAYLEFRETVEGNGPGANREVATLSSVFNHGMRIRQCAFNPTYGVRRNEEQERTRYVTDQELRTALRAAPPALRYLMWATYLTGFRQGDMRRLTKEQLTPEGIRVREGKGGKHEMRLWTESLRKVVRRALARTKSDYVFTNAYGRQWTADAINNAMQRMKARIGADWTFHDLRAKAESDHDTGLGLMRRYSRAKKIRAVR